MSWLERHQVLVAGLVLAALVVLGVAVLALRGFALVRTARGARRVVEEPLGSINSGLADAERRVGAIAAGQVELTDELDRVGAHTTELRLLVNHAGRALAVLRAPLRYLGR